MDALHGRWINEWRKSLTVITRECCEQYWTSPGDSTPQSSSYTATNHHIMKTIKIRRTRHAEHCWRCRGEIVSGVLLWTPSHGRAMATLSTRTNIQQLCTDTGFSPEDLLKSMDDREVWWERARNICADGATWWWWWWRIVTRSHDCLLRIISINYLKLHWCVEKRDDHRIKIIPF